MENEKQYQDMNPIELRAAISAHLRESQPPAMRTPDAPGCAGLSDKSRDTAAELYGKSIMSKRADELSPDEISFLRASVISALKDMS